MWSRSRSTGLACCATPSSTRRKDPKRAPSGACCGRSLDQLDRVVAVPFGGACDGRDLAALCVDQNRGRHAECPAYRFKILKNLSFFVAEIAEIGQLGLFQEVFRLLGIAGVDIDRHHLEILA